MKYTVCLNAIVKDEEAGIENMLRSVTPSIDYYVIVDTGSTDRTKEVIKKYFDSVGIEGEIHDRPWYNHFGKSRTEALELCYGKADYVLIMDATDGLEGKIQLPEHNGLDGYKIKIKHGGIVYWRVQLVKNDPDLGWKYHGAVHEYIGCDKEQHTVGDMDSCSILYNVTPSVRDKNPNKYHDDAKILEAELQKDPTNVRNQFYLAQSYKDAKMFDKAITAYKKRIEMGGWYEEIYVSYYSIAVCLRHLDAPESEIEAAFLTAYEKYPHRAEPLYSLAQYFREKKQYEKAFKYGRKALSIPYPSKDILFVQKYVYDYALKDEVAVAAYYVGEHELAVQLNSEIYPKVPDYMKDRIRSNAEFSINALRKQLMDCIDTAMRSGMYDYKYRH